MRQKKKAAEIAILCIFSLAITIVSYVYMQTLVDAELSQIIDIKAAIHAVIPRKDMYLAAIVVFLAITVFFYRGNKIALYVYKYRFILTGIIFVLCVCLEIHGSSIGMWARTLGRAETGELIGISRAIRSDEWAVSTPMMLSQYYNATGEFPYFSDTVRGMPTDMFMVYGQPVRDIAILFRPFHWGYLFLSPGKGLSFFWCGRFLALLMVSFEMIMLVTDGNKKVAAAGSTMISLAPVVQWWFAINGFIEMLVFSQLSILMLDKYMKSSRIWEKAVCTFVISICAGGFVLTLYPAWQVPMAYLIVLLAVWIIVKNFKQFRFRKSDCLLIIGALLFIGAMMLHIWSNSKETIELVMNTAYPGKRVDTGGNAGTFLVNYPSNIWYAMMGRGSMVNAPESAQFIDFFPLCYIMPITAMVKKRKIDGFSLILLVYSSILLIWCIWGFPLILAKATLFSYSTATRAYTILGVVNLLLLMRGISIWPKELAKTGYAVCFAVLGIAVVLLGAELIPGFYVSNKQMGLTCLIFAVIFCLLCYITNQRAQVIFAVMIAGMMFYAGGFVNPIVKGVDTVYNLEEVNMIQTVCKEDPDSVWVMENVGPPLNNTGLLVGASSVNTTNVYPALERWKELDPAGKYEEIYNRYAFIIVQLKHEGAAEFILNQPDVFTVKMTAEQLQKLKIKYIFSSQSGLSEYSNENVTIEKIRQTGNFFIYELQKK